MLNRTNRKTTDNNEYLPTPPLPSIPPIAVPSSVADPTASTSYDDTDQCNKTERQCLNFCRDQTNFESYQVVWLASHVDDIHAVIDPLHSIVDYTKLFNNVEECLKSIQQEKDKNMATFFVCEDQFSEILIPALNDLKNIRSLSIHCPTNEKSVEQDTTNHVKVESCRTSIKINYIKKHRIHTELSSLLDDLVKDINDYIKQKRHIEPISFNVQIQNQGNTTDKTLFTWWPYFIQILCHLQYPKENRPLDKLIHFLKDYLKDNPVDMTMLDRFEKEYIPEKTVSWYTSPTCLYEMLNRAMRQHNIPLMFLFGFFIQNLHHQLLSVYDGFKSDCLSRENYLVQSYRGQEMSREEMEELFEDNQDDDLKISVNSLLSTSLDRLVSLFFLPEPEQVKEEYVRVLLEITSDIRQKDAHPFGDISHFSAINDEAEILFMAGANFDLKKGKLIYDESEKLYIMKLELMDKYFMIGENYFSSLDYNEKKKLINCIFLTTDHFYRASFENINTIFDQLFDIYPLDKKWILPIKYHCLARYHASLNMMNLEEALVCYEESVKRWLEYVEHSDDEENYSMPMGKLHHDFAFFYHDRMKNSQKADEHYDQAIKYYRQAQSSEMANNHEHIDILMKISELYIRRMDLCEDNSPLAENYGLLAIESNKDLIQHRSKLNDWNVNSELLEITGRIARIYKSIGKYDDALHWFEKALQLQLQQEPRCFYSINEIYEEMIEIYVKCDTLDAYQSALKLQLLVHENTLKNNDPSTDDIDDWKNEVALSHSELAKLYLLLHDQSTAKQHLTQARTLYEETNNSLGLESIQVKIRSLRSENS